MTKNTLYKFLTSASFVFITLGANAQLLSWAELDTMPNYTLKEALEQNPLKVYKLNLKKQKLTTLPAEIFQFKNLQVLNLKSNKLTVFPEGVVAFDHLQELNIAANRIEIIPPALGELIHLKRFIAGSNKIITLPPTIKNLKNLVFLDLWGNNIGQLPVEIQALKDNLKEIDMRVIMMSKEEHQKIKELLPNTKIRFSRSCGCGF